MAVNFVKFIRGTQAAYDRVINSGNIDGNTLYFVYDKDDPTSGGLLYLGDVLIGGTGSSSQVNTMSLARLTDVSVTTAIEGGSLLQYNALQQKWTNVSLSSIIQNAGISAADVYSGTANQNETVVQALARLVTNPKESDIAIVDNISYVYDGSAWLPLVDASILTRIETLETEVSALQTAVQAVDTKISNAIANANHLTYKVLNAGQTINDVNPNSPNLDKTIFLVPDSNGTSGNTYKEYMFVNGNPELLGTWGANLDNYVTTSQLSTTVQNINTAIQNVENSLNNYVLTTTYNTEVGNISALRTATGKNNTTLVDEMVLLYDRLKWNEMT